MVASVVRRGSGEWILMWSDIGRGTLKRIPFLRRFKIALDNGNKTATFRRRIMAHVGERFIALGMIFEVTDVIKMTLKDVRDKWWMREGVSSLQEFDDIWTYIHPKMGVNLDFVGYLHLFERVG